MGLMDHRASWEFHVNAPASDCITAFAQAMTGGSKFSLTASSWKVVPFSGGADAVYQGRGGAIGALTALTGQGGPEEDSAVGSKVEFRTQPSGDGRTICRMHLAQSGRRVGFTSDARFIRPAMQRVEAGLRQIDSSLSVTKH